MDVIRNVYLVKKGGVLYNLTYVSFRKTILLTCTNY